MSERVVITLGEEEKVQAAAVGYLLRNLRPLRPGGVSEFVQGNKTIIEADLPDGLDAGLDAQFITQSFNMLGIRAERKTASDESTLDRWRGFPNIPGR